MIEDQQIPQHQSGLIWRNMDDGLVLVSPTTGNVRVLNPAGAVIWHLIDGQKSVSEIETSLVGNYDVSQEQAAADLNRFLTDLVDRGLLTWGS